MPISVDSKLAEISTKIDLIKQTQDKHTDILQEQGKTLLRNTITVEIHEKRSTLLEADLKLVKTRVTSMETLIKFWKWLGAGVTLLLGLGAAIWEAIKT